VGPLSGNVLSVDISMARKHALGVIFGEPTDLRDGHGRGTKPTAPACGVSCPFLALVFFAPSAGLEPSAPDLSQVAHAGAGRY